MPALSFNIWYSHLKSDADTAFCCHNCRHSVHLISRMMLKWVYSTSITFIKYVHWMEKTHTMQLGIQYNRVSCVLSIFRSNFLKWRWRKKPKSSRIYSKRWVFKVSLEADLNLTTQKFNIINSQFMPSWGIYATINEEFTLIYWSGTHFPCLVCFHFI